MLFNHWKKYALFAVLAWGAGTAAQEPVEAPGPVSPEPLRLTLESSLRLGLEQNPQLKVTQAQLAGAKAKELGAKSNFYPQLNATGTLVRSNTLPEFKTGAPYMLDTSFPLANGQGDPANPDHIHKVPFAGFEMSNTREGNIYAVKVEATYPLYTGGRIVNGWQATQLETAVQEQELRRMEMQVVYQVKEAYYGVLLAREMVEVVDQSMATLEAHYQRVKDLYANGYVSNLDLLQVESQLGQVRPQQIQTHNGLQLATLRLLTVLNLPPDSAVEVEGELAYTPAAWDDLSALKATAAGERPELKGLELRLEQTEKLKKIARAGYLPTAAAFANYQWNRGQELPPNDTIWRDGWQAGVSLSVPLFNGFKTESELRAARASAEQVRQGQAALAAGIEAEVTASVLQLHAAEERVAANETSVKSAEKQYEAAERRYRSGLVNHLDVMDAEISLKRARADRLLAVHDCLLAQAGLERALGRMENEGVTHEAQ